MNRSVHVIGVGMIPFTKAGASESYHVMGAKAARNTQHDAHLDYQHVQRAYVGYVFGDSTCGQAAVYDVGLTGIPVINVNNHCATGSTALYLARQAVQGGAVECALALGFEQMGRGALGSMFSDRDDPAQRFLEIMRAVQGVDEQAPRTAQLFGGAGRMHMQMYGTRPETFVQIAVKARKHAANNPYSAFRDSISLEQVMASPPIFDPLTRLQCCPPTCGAAAAIVCSADFAKKHGLDTRVTLSRRP